MTEPFPRQRVNKDKPDIMPACLTSLFGWRGKSHDNPGHEDRMLGHMHRIWGAYASNFVNMKYAFDSNDGAKEPSGQCDMCGGSVWAGSNGIHYITEDDDWYDHYEGKCVGEFDPDAGGHTFPWER